MRRLGLILLLLLFASTATAATIRGTKAANLIVGTPIPDHVVAGAERLVQVASANHRVDCGAGVDIVSADTTDKVSSNCEVVSRRLSVDPYQNPTASTKLQSSRTASPGQHRRCGVPGRLALAGAASNIGTAVPTTVAAPGARLPGTTGNAAPPGPSSPHPTRASLRRGARRVDREHADDRVHFSHVYTARSTDGALVDASRRRRRTSPRQGLDRLRQRDDEPVPRTLLSRVHR
jgi:hypothetical protein